MGCGRSQGGSHVPRRQLRLGGARAHDGSGIPTTHDGEVGGGHCQGRSKEGNLPTEILLEDTDGLRRPPWKGGRRNPSVPSPCSSPLLLLTCSLLMTSSHSEGRENKRVVVSELRGRMRPILGRRCWGTAMGGDFCKQTANMWR